VRKSILFVLLFVVSLGAQSPRQTQSSTQAQQPPRFRGGTNLVRVDVFATRGGTPLQNLTQADFEVLEDGKPQTIDSFQHVVVEPTTQDAVIEPSSVSESLHEVADPHRRVFVIYLDTENVDVTGSHNIRQPLIDMLNRVLGPDDLVGVMTPTMSPDQITFARKTQVIEDGLTKNWIWGRRDTILLDQQETMYSECFPPIGPSESNPSNLAKTLIARRRERLALDSIRDLVRYMSNIREGRTAVITVSDGWPLYKPDETITDERKVAGRNADPLPGAPPPVGVGPGGTLTSRPYGNNGIDDRTECERDRMELAMTDDERYFRDILGEANRSDVSFYTIDPRGLVAFDSPIGPDVPPPPSVDLAILRTRENTLRELAENTDGLALLNSNDLGKQLRRVSDDLTSYYLIGYYSTNAKLDGKYRTISVHVKQPGVEIRARKGYRAPTEAEVASAAAAAVPPARTAATQAAISAALGAVDLAARAGSPKRLEGEPAIFHRGPTTGNQLEPAASRTFSRTERVHFEMEAASGAPAWTGALLDRNGHPLPIPIQTGERLDASTGQRWLTADLTLAPLGAGDYLVQLTRADGTKTLTGIRVTQ
jgi:VWFA-related protein